MAGPNVGRECPGSAALRDAFRIEVKRRQRRSDGTVTLHGQRLKIPSRYRQLAEVHLLYARWDLSRVDLIEGRSGASLCPVRPLDKAANAQGVRLPLDPNAEPTTAMPDIGIAPLLKQMIADYAATGLPMGRLAMELEGAGYIRVQGDPKDARARVLQLTKTGKQLMLDSLEVMAELEHRYILRLDRPTI